MAARPVNKEGLNLSGYIKPDERTKQRLCLRCRAEFRSYHAGNRICDRCARLDSSNMITLATSRQDFFGNDRQTDTPEESQCEQASRMRWQMNRASGIDPQRVAPQEAGNIDLLGIRADAPWQRRSVWISIPITWVSTMVPICSPGMSAST